VSFSGPSEIDVRASGATGVVTNGRCHDAEAIQIRTWGAQALIKGLYAAANGLMAIEKRQSVIANNIANAATPGFRRHEVIQKGFYDVFSKTLRQPVYFDSQQGPGGGPKVVETFTDTSNGPVATTGEPLNLAIVGPGFFAVTTPQGDRYTRNGHLTIDVDGQLATVDGGKVQSTGGGPITVQGGSVEVDDNGGVSVDGQSVGSIRLVEFQDPHMLTREGNSNYVASAAALDGLSTAVNTRLIPGSLELSNVQLPYEMIQMTLGLRAYAANQKVINSVDETVSRLIDQVGTPT
jgi:flagellar basal-body rod protein FlgF